MDNANHPFEDQASLIPELTRTTLYADGSFDLTPNTQIYTELLANRRVSKQNAFRQFWTYNYTSSGGECFTDENGDPAGCVGSDPFSVGWTGHFLLSPLMPTDWFASGQTVDYTRAVLGMRGGFSALGLKDWSWDIYGQSSRSLGKYSQQVILQDAIDSQSFRTESCVGATLPVSGRDCIDINFTDPRVLSGAFTQAERDFLFDTDVGKTKYYQNYLEGSIAGNWFDVPAGPVGMSLGFHWQQDEIDDVPGEITRAGNSWGLTSAGITAGKSTTSEGFAELAIPFVKDIPFFKSLGMTLSGRYTNVSDVGNATTYKVGLNYEVNPQLKFSFTRGTSFRAPALFELYLADQTDFQSQRAVDPCINWGQNLIDGLITQRFADNCANPAGPGGGVDPDHPAGGSSAQITTSGGLGLLKPENSLSTVYGIVYTPTWINLSVAVDYFEIGVKNEVTTLGTNVASICYNSENFLTDPVCDLFVRNPQTQRIDEIFNKYINISSQKNRGIDLTVQYRHDLPWQTGLTLDGQFTWKLEDTQELFPGTEVDSLHTIGNPQFTGNIDATFKHGAFSFLWGAQLIGEQNSTGKYGQDTISLFGTDYLVQAHADFQAIHHASIRYDWKGASFIVGVSNIFDKAPPALTTVSSGLGQYNTVGISAYNSQYTEGFYGRRGFVRISKTF